VLTEGGGSYPVVDEIGVRPR